MNGEERFYNHPIIQLSNNPFFCNACPNPVHRQTLPRIPADSTGCVKEIIGSLSKNPPIQSDRPLQP
jgi:hypothetical protein